MKTITIVAADGGWMLRSEGLVSEQFFTHGAAAEAAAIRLAQGLAETGEGARVEIYLRDGSLGRRFAVPALRLARAPDMSPAPDPNPGVISP